MRRPGKAAKLLLGALALALFLLGVWGFRVSLAVRSRATFKPPEQTFSLIGLTPDGSRVATAAQWEQGKRQVGEGQHSYRPIVTCGPLRLWNAETGRPEAVLGLAGQELAHVGFSPDGRWAAVEDRAGELQVWDVTSGRLWAILEVSEVGAGPPWRDLSTPSNFRFSPDGRLLAYVDRGQASLRLWDIAGRTERARVPTPAQAFAFSPDGQLLAVAAGTEVRIWDTASGQERATVARQKREVWALALSPDNKRLATFAPPPREEAQDELGHPLLLWDLTADREPTQLPVTESHNISFRLADGGWLRLGHSLVFSEDGRLLVFGPFGAWKLEPEPVCLVEVSPFAACTLSVNREWLVRHTSTAWGVGSSNIHQLIWNHNIELVNLNTSEVWPRVPIAIECTGPGSNVRAAIAPDSHSLLVTRRCTEEPNWLAAWWKARLGLTAKDRTYSIFTAWDIAAGAERDWVKTATLWSEAHFSPDGRTLAVRCEDGTIQLWDLPPRRPWGRIIGLATLFTGGLVLPVWLAGAFFAWLRRRRARRNARPQPAVAGAGPL